MPLSANSPGREDTGTLGLVSSGHLLSYLHKEMINDLLIYYFRKLEGTAIFIFLFALKISFSLLFWNRNSVSPAAEFGTNIVAFLLPE